jgi:peptidoglycan/xylan/chitin deacetylase (PgdA/CDA1 family)
MTVPHGLAVMYHYIRPRGEPCPAGIRPLWTEEFEQQLDWLSEQYEILDSDHLAEVLAGTYRPSRPWCVLTFDDGTKDHATVATPILQRRGLSGFFFLLTGPWLDKRLPVAHRVHVLLSRVPAETLWQALLDAVRLDATGDGALPSPGTPGEGRVRVQSQIESLVQSDPSRRTLTRPSADLSRSTGSGEETSDVSHLLGPESEARRIYHYEDSLERMRIKYALNFALPEPFVDRLTGQLISQFVGDEANLAQEWFVTAAEARAMAAAGMVLGAHGRNHLAIGRLSPDAAEAKIRHCHATLADALGFSPQWYAYPFGGAGACDATLDRADVILQQLGYHSVFIYGQTHDPWLNIAGAGFSRLDRFDCIRFPPRGHARK